MYDVVPTKYLAKIVEKDIARSRVASILEPGASPPWLAIGVRIYRVTLSFEAKYGKHLYVADFTLARMTIIYL